MKIRGFAILFSRVIYSINWFFLSPIIPFLLHKYSLPQNYSALIPISFFIGAAFMQIPSALISTKIGMKTTYSLGLLIMGVTDILIAFSNSFLQLLIFYGLTGAGAAFFFSSAGGTLASLYSNKTATIMGIYNSLYSIGGAIGLTWGLLDEKIGFVPSTLLLGSLTIVLGIINLFSNYENYKPKLRVITNRNVLLVALGTAGAWGEFYTISELYPSFADFVLKKSPITYGLFSSILLYSTMVGGFLTFLMDLFKNRRFLGLAISTILGIIPALMLYTNYFLVGMVILGLFNQISISLAYAMAIDFVSAENSSIALGELNAIQIGTGTLIVFISSLNLALSWYISVIIDLSLLAFLIPFLKLDNRR